jgi:catechol 2,3-dioxygenase-like lactoylglutathione lyase family enzyme
MINRLTHVTIMVRDQDEALEWCTQKLGFRKVQDERNIIPGFRWLTIAPAGEGSPKIVRLKAEDQSGVGWGTTWVLEADDCRRIYEAAPGVSHSGRRPRMRRGASRRCSRTCTGIRSTWSSRRGGDDGRDRKRARRRSGDACYPMRPRADLHRSVGREEEGTQSGGL